MTRPTRTDPTRVNGSRFPFPRIFFFTLIFTCLLSAQSDQSGPLQSEGDSTKITAGGLSVYITSEKLNRNIRGPAFELHKVELMYPLNSYQSFLNRSLSNFTYNPFTVDVRESSYYVPVRVRDELNLIMNRPRDCAFLPVLGVAWIAYQLGSRYLELRQKNTIDHTELLQARPALPLLLYLWQKYPQTARELYHQSEIQKSMTFKQLQEKLNLLQQNNLIKSRFYNPDSVQYFPGLLREQMITILNSADHKAEISENDKIILQTIRSTMSDIK